MLAASVCHPRPIRSLTERAAVQEEDDAGPGGADGSNGTAIGQSSSRTRCPFILPDHQAHPQSNRRSCYSGMKCVSTLLHQSIMSQVAHQSF